MDDNASIQRQEFAHRRREANLSILCSFIQVAGAGLSIVLAYMLTMRGRISIGEFGACIAAFLALQSHAQSFFAEMGTLRESIGFVTFFRAFMNLPEEEPAGVRIPPLSDRIELRDVSSTLSSRTLWGVVRIDQR